MFYFNIILGIIIPISLLLLGLLVFLNNPKSVTSRTFLLMAIVSAGAALGVFLSRLFTSSDTVFFWIKFTMVFASVASPSILFFIFSFPKDKLDLNKKIIYLEVILSAFFIFAAVSNLLFTNAEYNEGIVTVKPGPLIFVFGLSFAVHLGAIVHRLSNQFKQLVGREKEQIKYLTYGIVLMLLFVGVFDLFFVIALNNTSFVSFGVASFLILEGSVFYSITRHRLLDIRLVVARTVAYTVLVATLFLAYIVVAIVGTSLLFDSPTGFQQIILYSTLTLITAYSYAPLKKLLEKNTDKIFYKSRYDSSELIQNLTKIMATTLGLEGLAQGVLSRLVLELRISKGTFVLLNKGKIDEIESYNYNKEPKFVVTDINALIEPDKILVRGEIQVKELKKIMEDLDLAVATPLRIGDDKLGVLLLGHKSSGEIYTDQDIKLLQILSPEISIAIENAKAYEEIRKFNITLQREIQKATVDLKFANESLKELDETKDEFVSVVSHELRTPMTAVKSYVWLALNGKAGPLNDKMRSYLEKVYQSSERLIDLINDVLDVSHIETGRINLDIQPISLLKVAEDVVTTLAARADEQKIKLILEKDVHVPMILADSMKLNEIFVNLIGNALKFTKPGGSITVSFAKKENVVETSVTDTGIGISQADLKKLFTKFGRIYKSYSTIAQSTGSGLGLYITKNYIDKMNGKIWVNSEPGKGTTFTFTFPIAKNQKIKQPHETISGHIRSEKS